MTSTKRQYSLILVAPGSIYSTFDTYNYYLDALEQLDTVREVWGFSFHNVIEYHKMARERMWEEYSIMYGDEASDVARAARELVLEIVLRSPDAVLFIDGTKFPPLLLHEIKRITKEPGRNMVTSCYITEAPYINDVTDKYEKYFDVLFTNDKDDARRRSARGTKNVFYLPHSYSPLVHYKYPVADKYNKDVFFCGTIFPERAELLSGIDWTGINALIQGPWGLADEELLEKTKAFGIVDESTMPNREVSNYYRGSKICINMNRRFGWTPELEVRFIQSDEAYSVGPRLIEAIACGAFVISEPRPELTELFGDSVPTFTTPEELEYLIRYYLAHEQERQQKADSAYEIVQGMTYNERAKSVSSVLLEAITAKEKQYG